MAYIGVSPSNGVRRVHTYTATASQTTFSGAGAEGTSLSYKDSNFVDVYQNGIKLGDADYTSTSGTSIVLAQGASVDDLVVVVVFDVFSVADTVSKADGGTFDGNVTMAGTLGVTGATTLSSNLTVDGGTIKLDGNYPTGTDNVALGNTALDDGSLSGNNNTAIGATSLTANTSGGFNTACGSGALESNTTASHNVAVGREAGYANQTGENNTLIGRSAGIAVTADSNTFIGRSSGSQVTSGASNTIVGRFQGNSDNLDIRTADNRIVLSDGDGNARLHINNNGFFTASTNRSISLRKDSSSNHVIHSNQSAVIMFMENTSSSPYGFMIDFSQYTPDNNSNYFIKGEDATAERFFVYSDGDVKNHDNSYGAISDVKLKEQITDASSQWDDIKALTVRKYKMKSDVANGDSDSHWRLGVVAQEVEKAGMSGLVADDPDMIENKDGEYVESGTTTKRVKYSILYMKAVKALQEAMARIETLETENKTQATQIADLISRITALENAE